ncbi:hypothetical protein V5799_009888 [Amblyomma americanum]|uniref:Ran gtpase-activating protein n=1 Tax=Amblyomma americanum TaxID=6943 RepID=A0AAQ4F9M7_AMBAM
MANNVSVKTENSSGQSNSERVCTSSGPLDRCGLISELLSWNRVLYGLDYELAETCPGKLSLRYVPHGPVEKCRTNAASVHSEAAFLISWLVEHHSCIDELGIKSTVSTDVASAPLRLRRPPGKGIRCLEISWCMAYVATYVLEEDVSALQDIEELRINEYRARDESTVVSLLRNNSSSLRSVQLSDSILTPGLLDALLRLEKCESVTMLDCPTDDEFLSDSYALTAMLRSMPALKTLTFTSDQYEEWNFSAIADALEANGILTTLDITVRATDQCSFVLEPSADQTSSPSRELYEAFEVNSSVRTLRVDVATIDAKGGKALASAICKNTCLVDLQLAGSIDDHCLIRIAVALWHNSTLENLDVSKAEVEVIGVLALCNTLRTNKTLKKLVLPIFVASRVQRRALAEKLTHCDGYRRVLLPFLDEPDLQALSTRLACPTTCPEEIRGIDVCNISEASLKLFFDALASSRCVQSFCVYIKMNQQAKIEPLCEMLKHNRSIRSVGIKILSDIGWIIQQLLNAIEGNEKLTRLTVCIVNAEADAAIALKDFIARNRTITALVLWMGGLDHLDEIARAMLVNPTIVELGGDPWYHKKAIFEALQRNRASLNRAADFVLGSGESLCAEAFELFSRTPCLVEHLMETSGQNEREAKQAIASAEKFLRDNIFDKDLSAALSLEERS